MRTLEEFMEALDEQAGNSPITAGRHGDDAINAHGDTLKPMFERWADRAGVPLDELTVEIGERVEGVAHIVATRIADDDITTNLHAELRMLALAAGLQFFCAGALWEQDRNLPDLGGTA